MNVFDCLSISITFNRSSKRVIFLLFPMFVPPSSFSFWPFAKDESPSMMAARLLTKTILATDYDHFLFSLCLLHLFSSFFHSWSIVLAPWFWRSRRSSVKIFKKTRLWNFLWSCRTRLLNDFNPSLSESFLKTYLFNRISCREDLHISIESSKWRSLSFIARCFSGFYSSQSFSLLAFFVRFPLERVFLHQDSQFLGIKVERLLN